MPSVVQVVTFTEASSGTTLTGSATISAGNGLALLIATRVSGGSLVTGVSDGTSNLYTQWPGFLDTHGGEALDLWICKKTVTGGTLTWSIVVSPGAGVVAWLIEVTNQDTATFINFAGATDAVSVTPLSPTSPGITKAGELVIGVAAFVGNTMTVSGQAFGGTGVVTGKVDEGVALSSTGAANIWMTISYATGGLIATTYNYTLTLSASQIWLCGILTFLVPAGGSGGGGTSGGGVSVTPLSVIQAALMSPVLTETWQFFRLDRSGRVLADITSYIETATVAHDSAADVKRTVSLTAKKAGLPVDFSTDFIKVYHKITLPGGGGQVANPLGVFTFAIPQSTISPARTLYTAAGQDPSFLLVENSFTDTFSIPAGTQAIPIVKQLAAQLPFGVDIIDLGQQLVTPLSYVAGDTRLKAINDVLSAIAYESAWCNHDGVLRSRALPDFTLSSSSATFDTTSPAMNVVLSDITVLPDRSQAYNIIVVEVSPAGAASYTVVYTNNSPNSHISVENWHPRVLVVQNSTLASLAAAQAYAKSLAQFYARVFIDVTLDTFPWSLSEHMDVYECIWNTQDEGLNNFNYVETAWSHICATGQPTTHTLQRVVSA